jgi:TfoX/Sxy family transcriptional regulator of competence genes
MAYDERLAERVREALGDLPGLVEKKMFGGIGYMVLGNMACGVHGANLIVRVGPERYEAALKEPHASPFDLTGRPMRGWVYVDPRGVEKEDDLARWVEQGVDLALSLPPKT